MANDAVPQFDKGWMGTAEDWATPGVSWARVLAAHSGQMTPEQKAYAESQMGAGAGAINPFATQNWGGWGPPPAPATPAPQAPAPQDNLAYPSAGPPAPNTTTAADQQVFLKELTQRMTQPTTVDVNDPNIKQQVDPFAAAQERARRSYITDAAERLSAQGKGDSGAMQGEERYAAEQAGQKTGLFASELVGRELQAKRDEIAQSLELYANVLSDDQKRALQDKLSQLDATLRREEISSREKIAAGEQATQREQIGQTGRLGQADIDLRRELGRGGLSLDAMRLALQDKQFGQDLGFRIGSTEADLNDRAMRYLFGG